MASTSSDDDQKQKVAMGYPSMDPNHQAQYMFPPQPPPPPPTAAAAYPCGPHHGYPPSSTNYHAHYAGPPPPNPNYPQMFGSSPASYHFPLGYSHHPNDPAYLDHVGSQKPYHPYPNSGEFYYPQQHYKPLVPDPGMDNGSSSFGRVMFILMFVLVASMCMMTLVMWFLFGTYIPEFEVASVKVSNFTVANSTLTGMWDVAVSVTNTNKELTIQFDRVMSSIFYKEALIGISAVNPFQVGQMQHTEFNFSMLAEQHPEENRVQGWVLPTLGQDHENGMVVFSMRLTLKSNYTSPGMVYRQENMRVVCENIQVMFSAVNGEGRLSPGTGHTCLIRVDNGLKEY